MKSKSFVEWGMIQWRIVLTLCAILVGYGALTTVMKRFYIRRYGWQ